MVRDWPSRLCRSRRRRRCRRCLRTRTSVAASAMAGPASSCRSRSVTSIPARRRPPPQIKNPVQGDPNAEQRGMTYYVNFNCVGCHAPNGGGGMGPALSNNNFTYGSQPENIFLSIYQGRPNGMPAWGGVLPDSVIWDLVTYIGRISNEPSHQWGRTFSANLPSPEVEQVPSEQVSTTDPWSATKSFNFGQKP